MDASIRWARAIGPAACLALSAEGVCLRVDTVFASAVNLEVEGTEDLVTLTGPSGEAYPQAVVLERPEDFGTWRLTSGSRGSFCMGVIHLQGQAGQVVVDLTRAQRRPQRSMSRSASLGAAYRACVSRLSEIQEQSGCDLRLEGLRRDPPAVTVLGEAICRAARTLGEAARGFQREAGPSLSLGRPVAALMGLGAGLTPSGDDFLCGFLAAARACHPGPVPGDQGFISALNQAVEENLRRTSRISGGLMRWAMREFWPTPLLELAETIAREQVNEALQVLVTLTGLGHSSGADIATGFLFGLETLLVESG